jgi:hypothetical protein
MADDTPAYHHPFSRLRDYGRMLAAAGFVTISASGHGGAFLGDMPYLRSSFSSAPRAYGLLRDRWPSLMACTLAAVARTPS